MLPARPGMCGLDARLQPVPVMAPLLDLDRALVEYAPTFEHPWLTALFVVLSTWWVKGPLLVGLGLCSDVWRRRVPLAFLAAAVATGVASLVVHALKETFDRERPPVADPDLGSLTAIPDNPSFPSGHSATAFAAATAVAILSPRLRPVALAIAAAVALSRVYLRVHFPLDVAAGAILGAALGALCALVAIRLLRPGARPQAA
jgi:undecaprenyl-diphosphatase